MITAIEYLQAYWRDAIEILILWIGIYYVLRAFTATRGARILTGLLFVVVAVSLLAFLLNLEVLTWIVARALVGLSVALVIIFQPELRSALARLGTSSLVTRFTFNKTERLNFLETLVDTAVKLSKKRYGALIAIERHISLEEQIETGVMIKAVFSPELALSIFHPKTALHDGGMIIAQGRIWTAGCVFPVSQREIRDRTLGLRHRAAIGLTEVTDAVAIVVSEETGRMSICTDAKLTRAKDGAALKDLLEEALQLKPDEDEDDSDQKELEAEARGTRAGSGSVVSH